MATPDVVIIGGGLVGCLCAWRIRQAGARVTVLEKSVPGAEASSAAAGILAAQSESREPGLMFDLARESRKLYASLAAELRDVFGVEIGFRRTGVLECAQDVASLDAHEQAYAWQRDLGERVERLDASAVREREPALASTIAGGLFFPDDAQLEPQKLMSGVAQAADRAGVAFRTGALVRRVRIEHGCATGVELDDGFVPAGHVVVAAGAWSALVEGARVPDGAVRPARGQIVELAARTAPIRSVVFGAGGYIVPRVDGRVLCGSTLEFVGYRNEVTAAGLARILNMALTLVPALAETAVARTWSNFRPYTPDERPLVGDADVEALTLATGHYRSGILMAPVTAEIVRDRIVRGHWRSDLDVLSPARTALAAKA